MGLAAATCGGRSLNSSNIRARAGLACSSRSASQAVSVSSLRHSSSRSGPSGARRSPSPPPSPSSALMAAGSPYVSRWMYSWSAAAFLNLG
eukprot:scaffold67005_cov28-Tisochrysis_lutea.AAC.7